MSSRVNPFLLPVSPVSPDPWVDIFLAAAMGLREQSLAAMASHEQRAPATELPRLYTIAARALWMLGEDDVARTILDKALAIGGSAPAALASVAHPQGRRWAQARVQAGQTLDRADAACDLAWLDLRGGDLRGARRQLDAALHTCPEHGEARRWLRFLNQAGTRALDLVQAPDPTLEGVLERDAAELCPHPESGWLSDERGLRRLASRAWRLQPPPRSALARLLEAGCTTRIFAMEADYSALDRSHPLVRCELLMDQAISLEHEGRPTHQAAARTWEAARGVDVLATSDAAQALAALGVRHPDAASTGLEAACLLVDLQPALPLWRAYRARLQATLGQVEPALSGALALLGRPDLDAAPWILSIEILRQLGEHDRALREVLRRLDHGQLHDPAAALLQRWAPHTPTRPMVSDRTRRRFPDPDGPQAGAPVPS